jgi:hypothetical protein
MLLDTSHEAQRHNRTQGKTSVSTRDSNLCKLITNVRQDKLVTCTKRSRDAISFKQTATVKFFSESKGTWQK